MTVSSTFRAVGSFLTRHPRMCTVLRMVAIPVSGTALIVGAMQGTNLLTQLLMDDPSPMDTKTNFLIATAAVVGWGHLYVLEPILNAYMDPVRREKMFGEAPPLSPGLQ